MSASLDVYKNFRKQEERECTFLGKASQKKWFWELVFQTKSDLIGRQGVKWHSEIKTMAYLKSKTLRSVYWFSEEFSLTMESSLWMSSSSIAREFVRNAHSLNPSQSC